MVMAAKRLLTSSCLASIIDGQPHFQPLWFTLMMKTQRDNVQIALKAFNEAKNQKHIQLHSAIECVFDFLLH